MARRFFQAVCCFSQAIKLTELAEKCIKAGIQVRCSAARLLGNAQRIHTFLVCRFLKPLKNNISKLKLPESTCIPNKGCAACCSAGRCAAVASDWPRRPSAGSLHALGRRRTFDRCPRRGIRPCKTPCKAVGRRCSPGNLSI